MTEHDENKTVAMRDIETIFEHPEVSEREAAGLFGEIQSLLCKLNTAANTLRVKTVMDDALAQDPTLNLGATVTINGTEFVDSKALNDGGKRELVERHGAVPF